MPPHIKIKHNNKIKMLLDLPYQGTLNLDPEAQELWDMFYEENEKLLLPGGQLANIIDWGSKLPGAVARIAGLLTFADIADGIPACTIKKEYVHKAIEIGKYFRDHACAVFGLITEEPGVSIGKRILTYIKQYKCKELKGRDLFDHTNLQSMREIQLGLNALVERGYIRESYMPTTHKNVGRPAATIYEVNPRNFLNT
jgi:hypothetical protein